MKTKLRILLALGLSALPLSADVKVSALPTLTSGTLDPAADLIYIVDASAGEDGSKAITPNNLLSGWGAVSLTGSQTLTNKTLGSGTTVTLGSDATGDIYYRASGGLLTRLGVGSTGQVLTVSGGLPSWAAAAGTLANWTEAISTASPNNTIYAASFTATGGATNIDAVIRPKGTGSILAQVPDGTTTGGDKRGTNAVDLQMVRSTSGRVAAGLESVIAGGDGNAIATAASLGAIGGGSTNTVSAPYGAISGGISNSIGSGGNYSAINGGNSNTANSNYGSIGGGQSNSTSSSGTHATIGGGQSNTINNSAGWATVGGGQANNSSADFSWIPGGYYATTRGIYGAGAWSAGRFTTTGDAQHEQFLLRRTTTDATQTEASVDGGTPYSATRIVMPNNHAYAFRGRLIARSSTGDVAVWTIDGAIKRGANAAATALVGTPTATQSFADAGATGWVVTIDADTTNGSLRIRVTGAASTTIHWVADLETVEVS